MQVKTSVEVWVAISQNNSRYTAHDPVFYQKPNSKYCKNIDSYLDGLNLEDSDESIEYIFNHFNNLNLQTKEKEYIDVAKELFEMIPDKLDRLSEIFAEKYLDIPIMKYYNTNTLFERIMLLENEDVVLVRKLFEARYAKVGNIDNEERNIRLLKQTMEEYIRGKVPTIKIILIEDFIKTLDLILLKPKKRATRRKTTAKVAEEVIA